MRLTVLALALLGAFVAVVFVQHALVPGPSPARHMVSEYANARAGWLMELGFAAWSGSLALSAIVVRRGARDGMALAIVLSAAAAGVLVLTVFHTQTVAGVLPPGTHRTTPGRLHDAGSGLTSLALLAGTLISLRSFRRDPVLRAVAIAALGIAIAATAVLLPIGQDVGGLRQRLLLLAGCSWQAALLIRAAPRGNRRARPNRACEQGYPAA